MSKEIHVKIHLPLTPMEGDPIAVEEGQSFATGEFARVQLGADRFAVEATDGKVYEIEVAQRGDGSRGSQSWRATKTPSREEFEKLGRSPVV